MEKHRRVAKAYARTPVITINGSRIGFDGYRIGINGLNGSVYDPKVEQIKRHIGLVSVYMLLNNKLTFILYFRK